MALNTDRDRDRSSTGSWPENYFDEMPRCSMPLAANQALQACKTTRFALQELRECLIACPDCPAVDRCELHEHFSLIIDQAVAGVIDEWGW